MLMDMARTVARRGTCNRLQVGALISREGRALSTGYNGPPSGLPHCNHPDVQLPGMPTQPCEDAVHAEANVVAFAAKFGVATDGADVYVTHSPCVACARLLINAGLNQVFFRIPFRDPSGIVLLRSAGVRCVKFNGGDQFELWTG